MPWISNFLMEWVWLCGLTGVLLMAPAADARETGSGDGQQALGKPSTPLIDLPVITKDLEPLPIRAGEMMPKPGPCADEIKKRVGAEAAAPPLKSTVMILRAVRGEIVSYCSGSILNSKVIVTAAHCLTQQHNSQLENPSHLYIHFGNIQPGENALRNSLRAQTSRTHPRFRNAVTLGSADAFDVGVLQISGAYPQGYGPALILPRACNLVRGADVPAGGCGVNRAEVPVCQEYTYRVSHDQDDPKRVYVVRPPRRRGGMRGGDSGGPAWVEVGGHRFLWGTASAASEDGADGFYEDFRRHDTWLSKAVRDMGGELNLP